MGLVIYGCFALLYGYGFYLTSKRNYSETCVVIATFLMAIQLIIVIPNINIPYEGGFTISDYAYEFMYYVGKFGYYIGYFIWSIIAVLLIYINLLIKSRKNKEKNNEKN